LREWFLPAFTTTTKSDQATASIIMMSAKQKYFSYGCSMVCGLPSVTLLGTKGDWQKMLSRLERLKTFGEEPTLWYGLLKPAFTKFVETFDDPESVQIKDFWQKIAHYSGGGMRAPSYLSGMFSLPLNVYTGLQALLYRIDHSILLLGRTGKMLSYSRSKPIF
jgi:hypothetical protein